MSWAIDLAERRVLPDPLVRVGMRRLLGNLAIFTLGFLIIVPQVEIGPGEYIEPDITASPGLGVAGGQVSDGG